MSVDLRDVVRPTLKLSSERINKMRRRRRRYISAAVSCSATLGCTARRSEELGAKNSACVPERGNPSGPQASS